MSDHQRSTSGDGLAAAFRDLTEGLSDLVRQHLEWMRIEFQREATEAGQRSGYLVLFAAIALVGYVYLNVSIVLLVGAVTGAMFGFSSSLLGMGIATCLLGFAHVGVGAYKAREYIEGFERQQRRLRDMTAPLVEEESWPNETTETESSSPEAIEESSPTPES